VRRLGCVRAAILLAQDFLFGLFAAIISYSAGDLPYYSSLPWQHCFCVCVGQAGFTFTFTFSLLPTAALFALAVWGSSTFGQVFFSSRGSFAPLQVLWPFGVYWGFPFLSFALVIALDHLGFFVAFPLWTIFDIRHLFLRAFSLLLFLAIAFFGCLFLVADDVTWHFAVQEPSLLFLNYDVIPDIGQLVPTSVQLATCTLPHSSPHASLMHTLVM
jgi:hypothetical protein